MKLSILAPAYKYPQGIDRILEAITPLPEGVELLVSDNSPCESIKDIISRNKDPRLMYWHNKPPLEAVDNWNTLLDRAAGEYVMLLHHDELPLGCDYLERLCLAIETFKADVLVQDVVLLDASLHTKRRHVPRMLREWVIEYAPSYLFRRNVIGPTAALVVRRALYPKFNSDLRWLIDVELYVRLRYVTANWKSVPDLLIGSVQDTHETLTSSLKHELIDVDAADRKLLQKSFPEAAIWLGARKYAPIRFFEDLLWKTFRVVQAIVEYLRSRERRRSNDHR